MKFAILLIIAAAVVAVLLGQRGAGRAKPRQYKRRELMTENELEFFGRLVAALPEHYIFPQVAMTALIEAASSDKKQAHSDRLSIAQHRVDYVVCNRRCEVVAVVELDDKTHSRTKDQVRDSRLDQGGIKTVRFQSRSKPTVDALRAAVLAVQAPAAPATPADVLDMTVSRSAQTPTSKAGV